MPRRLATSSTLLLGLAVVEAHGPQAPDLAGRVHAHLAAAASEFIDLRHDLHRHPEISGQESRTAGIIAGRLRALGLDVQTGVGGHGVIGILKGGRPGPLVAYRADIDAVRSADPDPVTYRSTIPGVRHQCGHDVHTAIALALASALTAERAQLPGTVMFIFQPAEETATGARAMLASEIFARAQPVAIFGLHTAPMETGQIGTRPGRLMPSRDAIRVTLSGSGDLQAAEAAVRAAGPAISTISEAQTRQSAPADFAFVRFERTIWNDTRVTLNGNATLASATARERVQRLLAESLLAIRIPDVTVINEYEPDWVPGIDNDAALTADVMTALRTALGQEQVPEIRSLIPAFSEDFGAFQNRIPGVFFFLGVSNSKAGTVGMPHAPNYVADDEAIQFGARAMALALLHRLQRG